METMKTAAIELKRGKHQMDSLANTQLSRDTIFINFLSLIYYYCFDDDGDRDLRLTGTVPSPSHFTTDFSLMSWSYPPFALSWYTSWYLHPGRPKKCARLVHISKLCMSSVCTTIDREATRGLLEYFIRSSACFLRSSADLLVTDMKAELLCLLKSRLRQLKTSLAHGNAWAMKSKTFSSLYRISFRPLTVVCTSLLVSMEPVCVKYL